MLSLNFFTMKDKPWRFGFWGFTFRDPGLQSTYRAHSAQRCLLPAKVLSTFHFVMALHSLSSYIGIPGEIGEIKSGFWYYFIPLVLAAVLNLCTRFAVSKPHLEVLLVLSVVSLEIWTAWMCHVQTQDWFEYNTENKYTADRFTQDQLEVINTDLRRILSGNAVAVHLLYSLPQMLVTLFLPGDYLILLLSTGCWVLIMILSPNITGNLVFAVVNKCVLCGLFLLFSCFVKFLMMEQHKAEHELRTHYEASITADNMLNHSLKNKMADAKGELEMYLSEFGGSDEDKTRLLQAINSLQKGMQMCQHRNALLKLSSGDYQPRLSPMSLEQFGSSLIAGRDVRTTFVNLWTRFDVIALGLIFENALSNAFKHGCPVRPDVSFTIRRLDGMPSDPGHVHLEFCVTNRANPARPRITKEFVDNVLNGKQVAGDMPVSSDRIGLSHCFMVAKTCHFQLTVDQTDDDMIIFKVCLVADTIQGSAYCNQDLARNYQLPPQLRFNVLDDSGVARRLVTHHLMKNAAPGSIKVFGEKPEEVPQFVAESLEYADVVIVDQHLDYDKESYVGTDVIKQLRKKGFAGLVCVRSANASEEHEAFYLRNGAHCIIEKDMDGTQMVAVLAREYHHLHGGMAEPRGLAETGESSGGMAEPRAVWETGESSGGMAKPQGLAEMGESSGGMAESAVAETGESSGGMAKPQGLAETGESSESEIGNVVAIDL